MRSRTLSEVAASVAGRATGAEVRVRRVVADSRDAGPGALFAALPGTRTDGHEHLDDAYGRGAAASLVRRADPHGRPAVVVTDPGQALLGLAADERRTLAATVVGITGSVGKTTTKDLVAAVLRQRFRVTASPASFNNQLGLPLTILAADERTEVLVCEIGAGAVGEIASLCHVARPEIGIVTRVGKAHLETFGSLRNVARAKGELIEALPSAGVAILNADDPSVRAMRGRARARSVLYGTAPEADVRAVAVRDGPEGRTSFRLVRGCEEEDVELALLGRHFVTAALAAAACGVVLGVPVPACAAALGQARARPGRMERFETASGVRIWNDAYNANPTSTTAALRTLASAAGRRVAVLGTMAELGRYASREHERIGREAAGAELHRLVAVGAYADRTARGARSAGMPARSVRTCETVDQAVAAIRPGLRPGDLVLVKGSRVMGLDRIVERLRERGPGGSRAVVSARIDMLHR